MIKFEVFNLDGSLGISNEWRDDEGKQLSAYRMRWLRPSARHAGRWARTTDATGRVRTYGDVPEGQEAKPGHYGVFEVQDDGTPAAEPLKTFGTSRAKAEDCRLGHRLGGDPGLVIRWAEDKPAEAPGSEGPIQGDNEHIDDFAARVDDWMFGPQDADLDPDDGADPAPAVRDGEYGKVTLPGPAPSGGTFTSLADDPIIDALAGAGWEVCRSWVVTWRDGKPSSRPAGFDQAAYLAREYAKASAANLAANREAKARELDQAQHDAKRLYLHGEMTQAEHEAALRMITAERDRFASSVELAARFPGMERETAQTLVDEADDACGLADPGGPRSVPTPGPRRDQPGRDRRDPLPRQPDR